MRNERGLCTCRQCYRRDRATARAGACSGILARHVTDRDIPLLPVRRRPRISRDPMARSAARRPVRPRRRRLPGLLLVGAFVLPPILAAVGMSFFRIELLRDDFTPFIGFRNYAVRLAADSGFLGPCRSPSASRS